MYKLFLGVLTVLIVLPACKKETKTESTPVHTNPFPGGKGGPFIRAFFSSKNGSPIAARMYLKYGDNKMPADTNQFDEKYNTMVEPGFSHHVHFDGLSKGTYFLYAVGGSLKADTTFTLNDSSKLIEDIVIYLK